MEPEIVCTAASGKSDGFGPLEGGLLINTGSLGLCRTLLSRDCAVLQLLGRRVPYEIVVGLNGRFWIKAGTPEQTVMLANTILRSNGLTLDQTQLLVKQVFSMIGKS